MALVRPSRAGMHSFRPFHSARHCTAWEGRHLATHAASGSSGLRCRQRRPRSTLRPGGTSGLFLPPAAAAAANLTAAAPSTSSRNEFYNYGSAPTLSAGFSRRARVPDSGQPLLSRQRCPSQRQHTGWRIFRSRSSEARWAPPTRGAHRDFSRVSSGPGSIRISVVTGSDA